jgi:hypothetical protein
MGRRGKRKGNIENSQPSDSLDVKEFCAWFAFHERSLARGRGVYLDMLVQLKHTRAQGTCSLLILGSCCTVMPEDSIQKDLSLGS